MNVCVRVGVCGSEEIMGEEKRETPNKEEWD